MPALSSLRARLSSAVCFVAGSFGVAGCMATTQYSEPNRKSKNTVHIKIIENDPIGFDKEGAAIWTVPARIVLDERVVLNSSFDSQGEYEYPLEPRSQWIRIDLAGRTACSFGISAREETWVEINSWSGLKFPKEAGALPNYQFNYTISNYEIKEF
jgi:hypothetical protein